MFSCKETAFASSTGLDYALDIVRSKRERGGESVKGPSFSVDVDALDSALGVEQDSDERLVCQRRAVFR